MRIALFTAAIVLGSAAMAQDAPPRPMLSDACRTEIRAICPPNGDPKARGQCMMANRDKISAPCKAELMKMRAAHKSMRQEHGTMADHDMSGGMDHDGGMSPPADNGTSPN